MKTLSMKVNEGDQTTGEALGVGVLLIDSPRMDISEGDETTAEGLAVEVFINRQGKNNETYKYGDPRRGSNDGRSPTLIY